MLLRVYLVSVRVVRAYIEVLHDSAAARLELQLVRVFERVEHANRPGLYAAMAAIVLGVSSGNERGSTARERRTLTGGKGVAKRDVNAVRFQRRNGQARNF
jgi:hypothetical protein